MPKRALIPAQSIDWLLQRLHSLGSTVEQLNTMGSAATADMAQMGAQQPPMQPQLQQVNPENQAAIQPPNPPTEFGAQ